MKGYLTLFAVSLMVVVHHGSAAFLESFTANPEISPPTFNKAALFLWTTRAKVQPGGRGPEDPVNPDSGNSMLLGPDSPVAETVLMNWGADNGTQITFYFWPNAMSGSCPLKMLRLMWSNDTMRWAPLWNRTTAQSPAGQWEAAIINIPAAARLGPVAFKWVFMQASTECGNDAGFHLDDITFPTLAPSAETMLLGKAPHAPLPSPAVCSALQSICQSPGTVTAPAGGGRRLRLGK
jgi:hypothetical protein